MEKIVCSKCSCEKIVKNGTIKGRQRYKCKNCEFNFTIEKKGRGKPESEKRKALHLYLEGMGFRGIGRVLNVSNVSVLKWIRSFGEKVKELRKDVKPETVDAVPLPPNKVCPETLNTVGIKMSAAPTNNIAIGVPIGICVGLSL